MDSLGIEAGDDPLVWFEGTGVAPAAMRHLLSDERGSVVGVTDSTGNMLIVNSYDEYGIPAPTNLGRFQYTGQAWIPEIGLYHYKARVYSPTLGRFLQTDPVGYVGGQNLYAYAANDSVNRADPQGTVDVASDEENKRKPRPNILQDPCGHAGGAASASCSGGSLAFFGSGIAAATEATGAAAAATGEAIGVAIDLVDAGLDVASDAVDSVGIDLGEIVESFLSPSIPSEAYETRDQYRSQDYQWRPGQNYNQHPFSNRDGDLPSSGRYRSMFVQQWDIGRSIGPQPRERLVVDLLTGRAWYTPDHYRTFIELRR